MRQIGICPHGAAGDEAGPESAGDHCCKVGKAFTQLESSGWFLQPVGQVCLGHCGLKVLLRPCSTYI